MTFTGNNDYIDRVRNEIANIESNEPFISNWADNIATVVDVLFPELQRDDIIFDTSTGIVVFPHPNGENAERDLCDWVNTQMYWRGEPEIMWAAFTEIVRQLCDKVLEVHHG
jgi:hypothetical protein